MEPETESNFSLLRSLYMRKYVIYERHEAECSPVNIYAYRVNASLDDWRSVLLAAARRPQQPVAAYMRALMEWDERVYVFSWRELRDQFAVDSLAALRRVIPSFVTGVVMRARVLGDDASGCVAMLDNDWLLSDHPLSGYSCDDDVLSCGGAVRVPESSLSDLPAHIRHDVYNTMLDTWFDGPLRGSMEFGIEGGYTSLLRVIAKCNQCMRFEVRRRPGSVDVVCARLEIDGIWYDISVCRDRVHILDLRRSFLSIADIL